MGRMKHDICDDWRFQLGVIENGEATDLADGDWRGVRLPHDWSIEGPIDEANDKWTGFMTKGVGWYRRRLALDPSWQGKRIRLEFEGMFRNATVFVNGKEVGKHPYGYTGVIFDITDAVTFDGSDNLVAVLLDNPKPEGLELEGGFTRIAKYNGDAPDISTEGWWYEGCGIYRPVWLIVSDPLHIDDWGLYIRTPEVSEANARVDVDVELVNDAAESSDCEVRVTAFDADESIIGQATQATLVNAQSKGVATLSFDIGQPALWSPEEPNLYMLLAEIVRDGETIDRLDSTFGVRWFEFTADHGFFLNGKHVQLRGGNIHHDFGGLGCALPDRAHERTIEALREMGFSTTRAAHNDSAPALMEACDRLGMLLWAETRYLEPAPIGVPPLIDLIRRARNHPSIICWSLANTAGTPQGGMERTEYLKALNDAAHNLDPTRPTAIGMEANADGNLNEFACVTDVVGYNGCGMGIDDRDHRLYPDRKMLISEFPSARSARGVYEEIVLSDEGEWISACDQVIQQGGRYLSVLDGCTALERWWTHADDRPWLAGGLIWAAIEYYGETVGWPMITSQFGPLDMCRFPKDAYYYFQQEWTDAPMIHIFPHWTWPGDEGKRKRVWCYSTCDEVELLLDGKSFGVQRKHARGHNTWTVPYEAGTLVAKGYRDGKLVCDHTIRTSNEPYALCVEPDRSTIEADGRDLSFVTIAVEDVVGEFCPTASNEIMISVEGPGRLIGLCNSDPACHINPKSTTMPTFNGLLLAIVQSEKDAGEIVVTASSDGLGTAAATVSTE